MAPTEPTLDPSTVTRLLRRVEAGDRAAADEVFSAVYEELRALAAAHMRREREGHTLRPTALVHEVFFKLAERDVGARDRAHFFAIAARAMRQVLVDHARRGAAKKRGAGAVLATLGGGEEAIEADRDQLIDLDRALETLDERQRRVVDLRFFAGLEEEEVADILGVTARTVRRDWVKARAWLYASLYPVAGERGPSRGSSLPRDEAAGP